MVNLKRVYPHNVNQENITGQWWIILLVLGSISTHKDILLVDFRDPRLKRNWLQQRHLLDFWMVLPPKALDTGLLFSGRCWISERAHRREGHMWQVPISYPLLGTWWDYWSFMAYFSRATNLTAIPPLLPTLRSAEHACVLIGEKGISHC